MRSLWSVDLHQRRRESFGCRSSRQGHNEGEQQEVIQGWRKPVSFRRMAERGNCRRVFDRHGRAETRPRREVRRKIRLNCREGEASTSSSSSSSSPHNRQRDLNSSRAERSTVDPEPCPLTRARPGVTPFTPSHLDSTASHPLLPPPNATVICHRACSDATARFDLSRE